MLVCTQVELRKYLRCGGVFVQEGEGYSLLIAKTLYEVAT
jgi:hypothetical protein